MTRSHGRCPKGERLRMAFPHGHCRTTTLVAGLRMTGMVAPMVLDGPINGDWSEAYVTLVLVPELRPGDVVIMDNLSSHERSAVRDKIKAAGAALRFLPRPTAGTAILSKNAPGLINPDPDPVDVRTISDRGGAIGRPRSHKLYALGKQGAALIGCLGLVGELVRHGMLRHLAGKRGAFTCPVAEGGPEALLCDGIAPQAPQQHGHAGQLAR
jgi:hypothetical protein